MDLCYVGNHTYLVCADRFTGWPIIYNIPPGKATAEKLISICRSIFQTYGAPDELSSDGGPPFTAHTFQQFLRTWGVTQRISSASYPQSNGRAELAVKTAKRIIYGNTGPQGSLNNDRVARAILQYRNTPIQGIGLSPAQMLLHRRLKDFVPAQPKLYKPHPEWVKIAARREEMLSKRNANITERYNMTTHSLPPLAIGDKVAVQNARDKRWTTTGKIVECLPSRQYKIKVDGTGRITMKNRRFLKRFIKPTPVPTLTLGERTIQETPQTSPQSMPFPQDGSTSPIQAEPSTPPLTQTDPNPTTLKVPRALLRLLPHNQPGITEQNSSVNVPSTRSGRAGRGREM